MSEQAAPNRRRWLKVGGIGCGGLLGLCVLLGIISSLTNDEQPTGASQPTATTESSTTAATAMALTPRPTEASTTAPTATASPISQPAPVATPVTGGQGSAPPVGDGTCPDGYPIKGNDSSSGDFIYHMPGQQAYSRTKPEQCFATEAAAQAAGYRRAER